MSAIEQRTPEWHAIRCGKATASRIADIVARTKTGWGASRDNYRAELVAERLTGAPAERFQSAAMLWGTETEGEARAAYAEFKLCGVDEIGFVDHPTIAMSGASPDGLVGEDGLVEIKCPNTATHIATLLEGGCAAKYRVQMQWQMACTGRAWCDFVSFDPRLPEPLRLYVHRVERDDAEIARLEEAVQEFLAEVDDLVARLTALQQKEAA